eukprot:Rhum_TRINITY_DN13138_c0_g1::Rhum_TRINITY_DN13138_c0_g1_i1::g.57394::m.57394/K09288/CCDC6, PTC; coiled-coil domain-containing protein 6
MSAAVAADATDFLCDEEQLRRIEAEAEALEAEARRLREAEESGQDEYARVESALRKKDHEVRTLKTEAATLQRRVEEEEEFIANGLLKRLDRIGKEKEQLAEQLEAEEEFLANSLQRQLTQMSLEKVELEKHLGRERKFIVHKLKKQLKEACEQKRSLEKLVHGGADGKGLLSHLDTYKESIGEDVVALDDSSQDHGPHGPPSSGSVAATAGGHCDSDTDSSFSAFSDGAHSHGMDSTMRKLQKEIMRLQQVCATNATIAVSNHHKCENLRQQLLQLSQDNFLKEVKELKLREELSKASGERNKLLIRSEMQSENELTGDMRRSRAAEGQSGRRASSGSNPRNLKAHTEHILARPLSPQSALLSPASWATPPATPRLSPRSSSGASTPNSTHYTGSSSGKGSQQPQQQQHRRGVAMHSDPHTPRDSFAGTPGSSLGSTWPHLPPPTHVPHRRSSLSLPSATNAARPESSR